MYTQGGRDLKGTLKEALKGAKGYSHCRVTKTTKYFNPCKPSKGPNNVGLKSMVKGLKEDDGTVGGIGGMADHKKRANDH